MSGTATPASIQQADDRRMWVTGAAVPAACHLVLAVFFYSRGLTWWAHVDVLAVLVHLTGLGLILKEQRLVGMWIVLGSAIVHVFFFQIASGIEAGWAYYFLALLVFPLIFFRRHARHMAVAVGLLFVTAIGALIGTNLVDPWLSFDRGTLDLLHGANLVLALTGLSVAGVTTLNVDRRHRAELARLRDEVLRARKLGQYTLGDLLGAGGMGQVYRATHALLRRPAAIKLIRDGEVSEHALKRFEREVQRTSELTHPNTIEIYDYGRTPEGIFYYVMEYLEGLDLERLVAEDGPQPAERVVHLLCQACEALEEAHESGLVHRDIKPANFFLCRRGLRPDVVKVLDFGLVKEIEDDAGTIDQGIAGTPAYLAPEAIANPSNVGPAADLYALGAVAYFLLTGETVFKAANFFAMCNAHMSEAPRPVSARVEAPLPEGLEDLVMACLAKEPGERPLSARALRQSLEGLELPQPWTEQRAREWWARRQAQRATRETAPTRPAPASLDMDATIDAGALDRT